MHLTALIINKAFLKSKTAIIKMELKCDLYFYFLKHIVLKVDAESFSSVLT